LKKILLLELELPNTLYDFEYKFPALTS
jgi:hypothetical protein